LKEMTGLLYNPITKRYWLAPNVDVNYMVHTIKTGA
ncbi:bifunctional 3-demethylubiquinol 3-O-methyltransferase/2-polyprenyl-6-hydroxyphenol methylase, partial [Acinetobacter baumannii]